MHTGKWIGFHKLNYFLSFPHKTANHSESSTNPKDGTHIQAIESLWSKLKKQTKNTKGIVGDKLESLLSALMLNMNAY